MGMSTKCPKNAEKMSEKCPEGLKTQFSDIFGKFLAIWSMLLFGDPVQCTSVTSIVCLVRVGGGPLRISVLKNYMSVACNRFLESIFRKLHYTCPFVIQRITSKNVLGIIVLENLISVT